MKRLCFVLFLGLAASMVGCIPQGGSTSSGESLSSQVARHEQQIQGLMGQVGQVEQVLPGQAEMWAQMQTMRQDLNTVQGRLDDAGLQPGEVATMREKIRRMEDLLRRMASQMAISTDSLDAPISTGTPGGGYPPQSNAAPYGAPAAQPYPTAQPAAYPAATPEPTPDATPTASATPAGSSDTADNLYNAGIKAFDQSKYQDAVVSFKDFTAAYPKHKLAGNAYFWQGESYFQMKDYARAALAYQEVIAKYPGSAKIQSAMLKQGIALHNAGKKDAAKERLNELVKRYPSSPEATRAKQFLATGK